jgi:IS5 family transposase
LRQKDRDARWTKKHGKSFFGYKNHVNADAKHKLIRRYEVTDAAVHDSQALDASVDQGQHVDRTAAAVVRVQMLAPDHETHTRPTSRKRRR